MGWRAVRRFVWTKRGKTVHIGRWGQDKTDCGKPIGGDTDAADVLWYPLCKTCRAAVNRWRYEWERANLDYDLEELTGR